MWIPNLHFPIIYRHPIHDQRVQDGYQVISVARTHKALTVSWCLCVGQKRQRRCRWNCLMLQHSVCPAAVQLVSLMGIGSAVRVMKWAVHWTDSVVAGRDVATPLVPAPRSWDVRCVSVFRMSLPTHCSQIYWLTEPYGTPEVILKCVIPVVCINNR